MISEIVTLSTARDADNALFWQCIMSAAISKVDFLILKAITNAIIDVESLVLLCEATRVFCIHVVKNKSNLSKSKEVGKYLTP